MGVNSKWPSEWISPLDIGIGTSKAAKGEIGKTITTKVAEKDKEKYAYKACTKEKAA